MLIGVPENAYAFLDYEVHIIHPCLLDRAQNSQPCSSCGLASVLQSLPFGLRDSRQINTALVLAQLTPQIHRTLSPVSRLGTALPIPIPPYPQQSPLGRKAGSRLWVFCCARPGLPSPGKSGLAPLYPHHWVYLKEPKPPF